MQCIVDCRIDEKLPNNFLELSLWGKPCYEYVIDAVKETGCFSHIILVSQSVKIAEKCDRKSIEFMKSFPKINDNIFIISGRAPCISAITIKKAISKYDGRWLISSRKEGEYHFDNGLISFYAKTHSNKFNAFCIRGKGNEVLIDVPDEEAVVINSANEFELALILKKKQQNRNIVLSMVKKRIEEKKVILDTSFAEKSICLIGHSQFDQWDVSEIAGYKVRNCGISGISSFGYNKFILKPGLLNCQAELFLIMHGTNDIVWNYTIDEMSTSIEKTIEYVRRNNANVPILFLSTIHTRGRMDRSNSVIDKLNIDLKKILKNRVVWIDTSFMDDKYGDLSEPYTIDGLHISDAGYDVLKKKIEKNIREVMP